MRFYSELPDTLKIGWQASVWILGPGQGVLAYHGFSSILLVPYFGTPYLYMRYSPGEHPDGTREDQETNTATKLLITFT